MARRAEFGRVACHAGPTTLRRPCSTAVQPTRCFALPGQVRINERIANSTSPQEVLLLHAEHGAIYNEVNFATTWNRLGRAHGRELSLLRRNGGERLAALGADTELKAREWKARSLSTTAHALAKLRLRGAGWTRVWEELESASMERLPSFNAQGLANTAWALVTAGRAAPELLDAIAHAASSRVGEFNAQNIANTAWALSKSGRMTEQFVDAIGGAARRRMGEFNSQNLANLALSIATSVGSGTSVVFTSIAAEATHRLAEFNAQDLANTAWAFATAGQPAPQLFEAIADRAASQLREFNAQDFASMLWAFATAEHAAPALFDAINAEAMPRLREFNAQGLSNTAWALAKVGHAEPALLDAIAAEALPRLREFNAQKLTNTVWAFATKGHPAPELFDAIVGAAIPRLSRFTAHDLSDLVWAYATAHHTTSDLFATAAAEAQWRLCEFNPKQIAKMAFAFATAGHVSPTLFNAIAVEAAPRLEQFQPPEIADMIWAFATINLPAKPLFDAIAAHARLSLESFDAQSLSVTAWAFAVADSLSTTAVAALFDGAFAFRCNQLSNDFSGAHLCQLHQWAVWYASERGLSGGLPTPNLLLRCHAAFTTAAAEGSSTLTRQVGSVLTALGLNPEREVTLEVGYTVDWLIEWNGKRMAVEVHGPSHFIGQKPTGATELKRRQLRRLGLQVVSVPHWEWDGLAKMVASASTAAVQVEYSPGTLQRRHMAYLQDMIARTIDPTWAGGPDAAAAC